MKKYICLLLAVLLLSACDADDPNVPETTDSTQIQTVYHTATRQELMDFFHEYKTDDPEIPQFLDCASVTDGACDLTGVIAYVTEDYDGCWFGFVKDERLQTVGVQAPPAEKPDLTYLGDGAVSCDLLQEDGTIFTAIVRYSTREDGGIDFEITAMEE